MPLVSSTSSHAQQSQGRRRRSIIGHCQLQLKKSVLGLYSWETRAVGLQKLWGEGESPRVHALLTHAAGP